MMNKNKVINLHEKLLNAGYHEFTLDTLDYESWKEKAYQKKVTDNYGIKYFITCYKYKDMLHPSTGEIMVTNPYEFVVQFNTQEDKVLEIKLWSDWQVEDADQFFEEQWCANNYKYYEELY